MSGMKWLVAAALLVPGALTAQEPGNTVRVNGSIIGIYERADSTGMWLDAGFIPNADVESLEVRTRLERHTGTGLMAGLAFGIGVPQLLKLRCDDDGSQGASWLLGDCESKHNLLTLVTLPVGLVLGGLAGHATTTSTFEPVAFPARSGAGIGLGLRVRF